VNKAGLIAGAEEGKLRAQPSNDLDREAEYLDELARARRKRWALKVRGLRAHVRTLFAR